MPKLDDHPWGPRVWLVQSDDAGNVILLGETADPNVVAAIADKTRVLSKWSDERKPMIVLLPHDP